MSGMYRHKSDVDTGTFNTINGSLSIPIDVVLAGGARQVIALEALKLAEDMIASWEENKDSIEPVPVEGTN